MGSEEDQIKRALGRLGSVLKGKWRLEELLGLGGMAAVYLATHRNGKRVAVKVLHAEHAVRSEVRTRFLREGYAANRVGHPGAVSILDDETDDDGTVFLVMDLLEGETVEQRFRRKGRLDVRTVLAIGVRLLEVLAAAHDKGIIHRDIKPENVMVLRNGGLRVLDFGIAHIEESAPGITGAGSAFGTPAYMPPEQARSRWELVDARSDLWAVGATLLTLLTGRTVHEGQTVNECLMSAMSMHAPKLATLLPEIPVQVAAVIDRALAFDKEQRWPDARAMQSAIRGAWESLHEGALSDAEIDATLAQDAAVTTRRPGAAAGTATTVDAARGKTARSDDSAVKATSASPAPRDSSADAVASGRTLPSEAQRPAPSRTRTLAAAAGLALIIAGAVFFVLRGSLTAPPSAPAVDVAGSLPPPVTSEPPSPPALTAPAAASAIAVLPVPVTGAPSSGEAAPTASASATAATAMVTTTAPRPAGTGQAPSKTDVPGARPSASVQAPAAQASSAPTSSANPLNRRR